ncbi:MAG: hypothetical protein NT003_02665 [Candidatus Magasanikbacteria bacterium]|nr:hypothetical protein [Candidatus Magasanikbacteria bacterium]
MMPGSIRMNPFSGTKSAWLMADLEAMFYVGVLFYTALAICFALIWKVTGWSVWPLVSQVWHLLYSWLGPHAAWLALIPSFTVVFVFRWNPMVIDQRRQFRYVSRWL